MPDERRGITHRFEILGDAYDVLCPHCGKFIKHKDKSIKGYLTINPFEDGTPGELFVTIAKAGNTWRGLTDSFAIAISLCLQHGVPLKVLVDKYMATRFEPFGYTKGCAEIRQCTSVIDYIFKWIALKYLPKKKELNGKIKVKGDKHDRRERL